MVYFIVARLDGHSGGNRSAVQILHSLLELDRELVVMSGNRCVIPQEPAGSPPYRVHWVMPATPVSALRGSRRSARVWARWGKSLLLHVWGRLRFAVITRRYPPTLVVHNGFPLPGSDANRVMDRARERVIIVHSAHEAVPFFQKSTPLLTTAWVSAQLSKAQVLVFVSPQARDGWASIADIQRSSHWVLPNTCRESEVSSTLRTDRETLRASLGLPATAFVAVCVGNVNPGKGQDVLLNALPQMIEVAPDLLVVVVGKATSAWAAELAHTVHERGLSEHVLFTGPRTDPYAFIRSADLLIHPSRAEGHCMVVLEAMALGSPVLASNVGGISSSVLHGESGVLVPPDDPAALSDAFRSLYADPGFRERLARRATDTYWSIFSEEQYRIRFRQIFGPLMGLAQPTLPSMPPATVSARPR